MERNPGSSQRGGQEERKGHSGRRNDPVGPESQERGKGKKP